MTNHIYVKQIQTNTIAKLEYQAINLVDICSDIDDTLSNKDFETTWSIGVDYRDKRPQLRTGTFADFAKYLVNGFGNCLSNENKDKSGAVFPSSILYHCLRLEASNMKIPAHNKSNSISIVSCSGYFDTREFYTCGSVNQKNSGIVLSTHQAYQPYQVIDLKTKKIFWRLTRSDM